MRDLDRADLDRVLADITAIRSQVAAGTAFQGYGPTALAATGALALAATSRRPPSSTTRPAGR